MKIGEVKVGQEYGAVDSPKSSYTVATPRRVKVLEIVTVEESGWSRGHGFGSRRTTRKVRRVKVEVLDEKTVTGYRYSHDKIKAAEKGATLVIEARQLAGPWGNIEPGLLLRFQAEQANAAKKNEIEERLRKLGFDLSWGEVELHVRYGGKNVKIEFNDAHAERLLALLEGRDG